MRDEKIDILKGYTIILVVFGHCIEYTSGHVFFENHSAYYDYLFKLIYSFHMPLFALVSGWLFWDSVKRHQFSYIVKRKILTLALPIVSWVTIWFFVSVRERGGGNRHPKSVAQDGCWKLLVLMGDSHMFNGHINYSFCFK